MSDLPTNAGASPEPTNLGRLEELYDEFEAALKEGKSPRPQEYVERAAVQDRPQVLSRLEALINSYRLRLADATASLVEGRSDSTLPFEPKSIGNSRLPEQIGRYRIVGWLGEGAMGVVYRAHHPVLNRDVALKTIRPQNSLMPGETARILAEAQNVAKLKHPNVVAIHDADEDVAGPYFTMALVEGGTLQSRISEFEFGTCTDNESDTNESVTTVAWSRKELKARKEKTLILMENVCRAVHAAHSNVPSIIHRDLKPGNILLDGDEPRVSDFGLAKTITAGIVVGAPEHGRSGTPSYMSPEQHRGEALNILTTSDVWAIGVILYRLCTGRRPFLGNTHADIKLAVLNNEPPRPRELNRHIDRDLEAIILKCLDKDPTRRYPTAAAVADDLVRCRTEVPIPGRPISRPERVRRWARRKPALAGLFGLAALTVGTIVLLLINWSLESDRSRKAQITAANGALDKGIDLSKQGDAAQGILWMARGLEMAPADDDELRQRIQEKLSESCRQISPLKAVFDERSRVLAVAFSPDGRTFLTGNADGIARLRDTATGQVVSPELRHPAQVLAVAFSPDGKAILTGCFDGLVRLWNPLIAEPVPLLQLQHQAKVYAVAVSPDGKTLFSGGDDGTVKLWDAVGGELLGNLDHEKEIVLSLAISSDGKTIATGTGDSPGTFGKARLWDRTTLRSGEPLTHLRPVWAVAFSPDDQSIVTGSENEALRWDLANPKAPRRWRLVHDGAVRSVAFSRDGKRILTGSNDGTVRRWDATSGMHVGSLIHHVGAVRSARFSPDPDNRHILTGSNDGSARLWQVSAALDVPSSRVALWSQVLTGMELDDKGRTRPLTADEWHERRQRLGELGELHSR